MGQELLTDDENELPVKKKGNSAGAAHTVDGNLVPLGYRVYTLNAAHGFADDDDTLGIPTGARIAYIQIEGADDFRWRDDGTLPTSSIGMLFESTDPDWIYPSSNLAAFKMIGVTGTPKVNVSFYK